MGMMLLPAKLAVPRTRKEFMHRQRLTDLLFKITDYPLTLLSAGPGYGKSSAVTSILEKLELPTTWYSVGEEDASGYAFCHYLNGALERFFPQIGNPVRQVLENGDDKAPWLAAIDVLLHQLGEAQSETKVLVVDDLHLILDNEEVQVILSRFLQYKPDWLKVVLLSRRRIDCAEISRRRVRAETLSVSTADLAFNREEIDTYFSQFYGCRLSGEELDDLVEKTEGWIMALQLIADGVSRGVVSLPLGETPSMTLETLFEFLARDVLGKQPLPRQEFLLYSSVLDELSPQACRAVLGEGYDANMLGRIERTCLFVVNLGHGVYRYHHLFHDFLRQEGAKREEWRHLCRKAATYYSSMGAVEQATEHLMQAEDWQGSADYLCREAYNLLRTGRTQLLNKYLSRLPQAVVNTRPQLLLARGESLRHCCRYQEALEAYRQAEKVCLASGCEDIVLSRAYKGMAEVYLDIIQPNDAENLLRKAAKVLLPHNIQEKAELVKLMAENKINQGKPGHAQRFLSLATEMLHMASRGDPDARLLLRTGRLEACVQTLRQQATREKEEYHPPRSFRETPLLLSLCYAMMGEDTLALSAAQEGIRIGDALKSPFVEAIGYARLGHAFMIQEAPIKDKALECYHRALDISDRLGVVRGRTEVMMGFTLYYGFQGEWTLAKRYGWEGVKVAEQVHDFWFANILRICLGIAAVLNRRHEEAEQCFLAAGEGLRRCSDSFALAVSQWWLAWLALKDGIQQHQPLRELVELCHLHGYDFLFLRRSLLGPPDARESIPLLQEARRMGFRREYADWLLDQMGAGDTLVQPNYTLRIQTLGPFRVWRGDKEITPREWQRGKARQLFQLLLTRRRKLVHKEQIMEALWPGSDPEAAARDFKVALNALMNALEPNRPPRAVSSYIFREGSAYGFNLASGYWLDIDEFESLVNRGLQAAENMPDQGMGFLIQAMDVYQGNFLEDVLYDEWCLEERERLSVLFLKGAETLARLLARRGEYNGCIKWAERILEKDNCWEEAYRLQMHCYAKLDNRGMVARTFDKCKQTLNHELAVSPSIKTIGLYRHLTGGKLKIENL